MATKSVSKHDGRVDRQPTTCAGAGAAPRLRATSVNRVRARVGLAFAPVQFNTYFAGSKATARLALMRASLANSSLASSARSGYIDLGPPRSPRIGSAKALQGRLDAAVLRSNVVGACVAAQRWHGRAGLLEATQALLQLLAVQLVILLVRVCPIAHRLSHPGGVGPVPQILAVRVWHVAEVAAQLDWGGRGGGSMLFGSLRGAADRTYCAQSACAPRGRQLVWAPAGVLATHLPRPRGERSQWHRASASHFGSTPLRRRWQGQSTGAGSSFR